MPSLLPVYKACLHWEPPSGPVRGARGPVSPFPHPHLLRLAASCLDLYAQLAIRGPWLVVLQQVVRGVLSPSVAVVSAVLCPGRWSKVLSTVFAELGFHASRALRLVCHCLSGARAPVTRVYVCKFTVCYPPVVSAGGSGQGCLVLSCWPSTMKIPRSTRPFLRLVLASLKSS